MVVVNEKFCAAAEESVGGTAQILIGGHGAFNPGGSPEPQPADPKWKISPEGSGGMVRWRSDGRDLYFLAANGGIMAASVSTASTFTLEGPPITLFTTPIDFPLTGTPGANADVSADGKTFVLLLPVPTN